MWKRRRRVFFNYTVCFAITHPIQISVPVTSDAHIRLHRLLLTQPSLILWSRLFLENTTKCALLYRYEYCVGSDVGALRNNDRRHLNSGVVDSFISFIWKADNPRVLTIRDNEGFTHYWWHRDRICLWILHALCFALSPSWICLQLGSLIVKCATYPKKA